MKKGMVLILALLSILIISGCVQKEPKATVAITFDTEYPHGILEYELGHTDEQGWINTITSLDRIAKENSIKFQFNVVGKTAEDYPSIISGLGKSQDISCHTYSHKNQTELNYTEKEQEIAKCKEAVESATGKTIYGNRFPYTKYDDDSFTLLKEYNYGWDSSAWASTKEDLKTYAYKQITEFPILPATTDWAYFNYENKTDTAEFYNILYRDLASIKDKEATYIVLLHPWVLSVDEDRINEFENFIEKLKQNNIKIKSLDEIYKDL